MAKAPTYRNRIVGHGEKTASEFQANPLNWRKHPEPQQQAIWELLRTVGWVTGVIENVRTGNLIDGHLRIEEALASTPEEKIPYTQVDLSEEEERKILLLLDPVGSMATADEELIQELIAIVGLQEDTLLDALTAFTDTGIKAEDLGESFELPAGDREPFQQLTFTVTDEQAETLKAALEKAKKAGPFVDTGNENSNGNALARIAEAYV
jgi:hypothetical protein